MKKVSIFPNDYEKIIGMSLDYVSFTLNTVSMSFGDGFVLIVVLSSLSISKNGSDCIEKWSIPVGSCSLMRLIGQVVSSIEFGKDGNLIIGFLEDNVEIYSDSDPYESYSIKIKGKEYFY